MWPGPGGAGHVCSVGHASIVAVAQELLDHIGHVVLEAGRLYKVDVPADMPMKQFWALTVYDHVTFSFIYSESSRTTLSSYDVDKMKKNADGGVTLYVGPSAPEGLEPNWIPTSGIARCRPCDSTGRPKN